LESASHDIVTVGRNGGVPVINFAQTPLKIRP
jgi:hypothetical protein